MTPKEKANELVEKYISLMDYYFRQDAKQFAIVAVNEIINAVDWHEFETPNTELDYWQQVKQEIENL